MGRAVCEAASTSSLPGVAGVVVWRLMQLVRACACAPLRAIRKKKEEAIRAKMEEKAKAQAFAVRMAVTMQGSGKRLGLLGWQWPWQVWLTHVWRVPRCVHSKLWAPLVSSRSRRRLATRTRSSAGETFAYCMHRQACFLASGLLLWSGQGGLPALPLPHSLPRCCSLSLFTACP